MDFRGYHCSASGHSLTTFTRLYNFIIPRCDNPIVVGEMTHNTQTEDAWKNHEENARDETPEPDEQAQPLNRHNGKVTTETGGASVSDLMAQVQ